MTLVTDTFASGDSIIDALEKIKSETGMLPTDVVVSVDRKEKTGHHAYSAKSMIEKRYGVRIHPIVDLDDIIAAIEDGVVDGKEVTMHVNVGDKVIYSKYSGIFQE